MAQTCILRLSDTELIQWLITDEAGLAQGPQESTLDEFAKNVRTSSITVIVPAREVLLLPINLPKMRSNKLLKAIPFALEERLADDIQDYHYVLPKIQEEKPYVAVISKAFMTHWVTAFEGLKLNINLMLPEQCCLPIAPFSCTLAVIDNEAIIRRQNLEAYGVDTSYLNFFLENLFKDTPPENIDYHIFGEEQEKLHVSMAVKTTQHDKKDYLHFLSQHAHQAPINLMQGDFRHTRQSGQLRRTWIISAAFIVIAVLAMFINHLVLYAKLDKQNNALNAQIDTLYKQNFPDSTSVVSPQFRMQEKLKKVLSGLSGNAFLDTSTRLAVSVDNTANITITNLHYTDGDMTLGLTANSFTDLKKFVDALNSQTLNVKQQSATIKKGIVAAVLEIKEPS